MAFSEHSRIKKAGACSHEPGFFVILGLSHFPHHRPEQRRSRRDTVGASHQKLGENVWLERDRMRNPFQNHLQAPSKANPCGRTYLNTVKSHQHGKTHESPLLKKVRPAHFSDRDRKGDLAGRGQSGTIITSQPTRVSTRHTRAFLAKIP